MFKERLISGIVMVIILIATVGYGGNVLFAVVGIVSLIGMSELYKVFKIENKDRSILRKNIGRAILNQNKDPYIDVWNIDFTSRKNKELYGNNIDESHQIYIEKLVTKYIQENLTFVVIEIEDKQHRTQIKKNLIGEISNCNKCKRSKHWIGNYSTKDNIIESGLWHDKELYKGRFEVEDLLFINK